MGVELEAQLRNPDSLEYVANRDKVAFLIANRFRSVWLYGDIIYYNFIPDGRKERKLVKKMHEFTEKVILQRWKELQQNFQQFLNRKKNSFLDLLLLGQRDNNLTFDDIREEVDTFMFEGWPKCFIFSAFDHSYTRIFKNLCENAEFWQKWYDVLKMKFVESQVWYLFELCA